MTTMHPDAPRTGFSDWFWQRATAVALIVLALWAWVELIAIAKGWIGFATWVDWNSCNGVRAARSFFVLVLLGHAWIGVKVIAEDYMRVFWLRMAFLGTLLVVMCIGFIWLFMNIWGSF